MPINILFSNKQMNKERLHKILPSQSDPSEYQKPKIHFHKEFERTSSSATLSK